MANDIVFCSNCGTPNKSSDTFCSNCGNKLSVAIEEPKTITVEEPSIAEEPNIVEEPNVVEEPNIVEEPEYREKATVKKAKALFENNWFIWLCVFILPPLGIYLIWKYQSESTKNFKIIVTVLAVLWLFILIKAMGGNGTGSATTLKPNIVNNTTVAETTVTTTTTTTTTTQTTTAAVPVEYKNALAKAKTYGKMMHMSKQRIYDQLTSEYGEGFAPDAAQYAVDNVELDYYANALEKAKDYQNTMNMSKSRIYDQLTSEYGEAFTADEAQYAIDNLPS